MRNPWESRAIFYGKRLVALAISLGAVAAAIDFQEDRNSANMEEPGTGQPNSTNPSPTVMTGPAQTSETRPSPLAIPEVLGDEVELTSGASRNEDFQFKNNTAIGVECNTGPVPAQLEATPDFESVWLPAEVAEPRFFSGRRLFFIGHETRQPEDDDTWLDEGIALEYKAQLSRYALYEFTVRNQIDLPSGITRPVEVLGRQLGDNLTRSDLSRGILDARKGMTIGIQLLDGTPAGKSGPLYISAQCPAAKPSGN